MAIENEDKGAGRLSSEYTSWRQPIIKVAINDHDRDVILRVVATEAAHKLHNSNPEQYKLQVAGIIDTMINRVGSGQFRETFEKGSESTAGLLGNHRSKRPVRFRR